MATEYGYELDPYRQLRKQRSIKGVRRTIQNTHVPSTVDQNETLKVEFPNLGRNDFIVPGTSRLSFRVNLNSSGVSADANRTIVNNLSRAIVTKVAVLLEGQEIYTLIDADVFLCFQDLWKTSNEHENAVYQGIQSEAIRKIRINAGDKGSVAKDVAAGKALGNKFYIPLDFEILSSHNPFFQYELKDRLSYELTFNSYGRVVVSSDTSASYTVSEIKLEFNVVNSTELAQMIRNKYSGKSVVLYDRVFRSSKEKLDKSDTLWNIDLKPNVRSAKGVLILFVDPADGGADYARDSEKFYNPKIKKARVTIAGNPNQLYASGMLPEDHFEEIQKHFADGKHRTVPHAIKEAELSDITLPDYLTTKYGLWFDTRTTDDNTLHGSGRKLETGESIHIEIEKEAEAAGVLDAYVYYIHDARLDIDGGKLPQVTM